MCVIQEISILLFYRIPVVGTQMDQSELTADKTLPQSSNVPEPRNLQYEQRLIN
jgi:hypothetical protein